jgi:hypothetical protein
MGHSGKRFRVFNSCEREFAQGLTRRIAAKPDRCNMCDMGAMEGNVA